MPQAWCRLRRIHESPAIIRRRATAANQVRQALRPHNSISIIPRTRMLPHKHVSVFTVTDQTEYGYKTGYKKVEIS